MAGEANIGLIGLGVMGENLALNIERHGYTIAVFNRHTAKVDAFVNGPAKGKKVIGCKDEESFIKALERPRKVILLVKAGDAVDETIAKIKPFLEKGDIVIDGGNSFFEDTRRREKELSAQGFFLIGSGVSGGEEGALWGPSLMPGGDKDAYEKIRPIWDAIAAQVDDGPCCTYLGPDGAGHFVKMVHNGIEYGDMQLICEAYDVMRRGLGLDAKRISEVFDKWNRGQLNSFLIEITAKILSVIDAETKKPLVELIQDKAGQKGTGKWTAQVALDLAVPIPTIDAALTARLLSAMKEERQVAAKVLPGPKAEKFAGDIDKAIDALELALYASKICSYAQGMALIAAGSRHYNWGINLAETARIWKGGCIIRAQFLNRITQAYRRQPDLPNLLIDSDFREWIASSERQWRELITLAQGWGIPTPAFSASLAYYDSYRCERLPQNLLQAQRDFFGAHTYERVDKPELGFIHTDWNSLLKEKANK